MVVDGMDSEDASAYVTAMCAKDTKGEYCMAQMAEIVGGDSEGPPTADQLDASVPSECLC